jgi:hypothetical protein
LCSSTYTYANSNAYAYANSNAYAYANSDTNANSYTSKPPLHLYRGYVWML